MISSFSKRPTKRFRVFLHIGMNKTGTSVIQRVMNDNRELLAQHGLLYPRTGCSGAAHYDVSRALGFHHGKTRNPNRAKDLERLKNGLCEEANAAEADDILISSENFVIPRPVESVKEFFDGFDCRIVVYLRRHDHWFAAAYNQAVRMVPNPPWPRGLIPFVRYHQKKQPLYGNYRHLVDRWAKVFGKERIVVRPYEPQQNRPNLLHDFLAAIGHGELAQLCAADAPRVNESLSPRQTYMIDVMQRAQIAPDIRLRIIDHILKQPVTPEGNASAPPEFRRALIEQHSDEYRYIAETYLGRKSGQLFLEPLPDLDAPWRPHPHPKYMEVVETVVAALTEAD